MSPGSETVSAELNGKDTIDVSSWPETAACPSCHRIVHARSEVRNGYKYVQKYCQFEHREFENLVEKVDPQPVKRSPRVNYPSFRPSLGTREDDIQEADIPNIAACQNIVLHLTPKCNSTCSVCYDRYLYGREEMSTDVAKNLVRRFTHKQIVLFGGEPTVRKDLPELIRFIRDTGNVPVLYTNGLKIADRAYLRELVESGLGVTFLSFDGFREEIYEKMRGGRHEYQLKLRALENLEQERMPTVFSYTVARGINDDQMGPMLDYIHEHPFIWELTMRPLYLPGVDADAGMGAKELLSREELDELVSRHLGFDRAYFHWWYEARVAWLAWLRDRSPQLAKERFQIPEPDQMVFQRVGRTLKPLLDLRQLIRLTHAFQARRWADPVFLHPTVLRIFGAVLKGRFRLVDIEPHLRTMGVVRTTMGMTRLTEDSLSSDRILGLFHTGKGRILPVLTPQ